MGSRSFATTIRSGGFALAALAAASGLHAQAGFAVNAPPLRPTALLAALSNYRVVRWASTRSAVRCAPAPLTERPGVEYARPHVAPLEEAFADAQSVKRAIAYRARSVAMGNRE